MSKKNDEPIRNRIRTLESLSSDQEPKLFCFNCLDEFPLPTRLICQAAAMQERGDTWSAGWKWPEDSKPNHFFGRSGLGRWPSLDGVKATFILTNTSDGWVTETICSKCRDEVDLEIETRVPARMRGDERRYISTWVVPFSLVCMYENRRNLNVKAADNDLSPYPAKPDQRHRFAKMIIDHWHEQESEGVD